MPKLTKKDSVTPHTRPNGVGKNGKGSSGRPPKWGEAKKPRKLMLTPLAIEWLNAQGGADYIEAMARAKQAPPKVTTAWERMQAAVAILDSPR
jgi:hypothetical protein